MSRRRAQKQQEKEDFLDQNPHLIDYETRLEVFDNDAPNPAFFGLVGSNDGGPEFPVFPFNQPSSNSPEVTIIGLTDGPDIVLNSNKQISLSDAGIGVGLVGEVDFDTIESDEILSIRMAIGNFFYPGAAPSPTDVDIFGGESLGIEFTGSGSGRVEFNFSDAETGERHLFQSDFLRGRPNGEQEFEVELPDGVLFNQVEISTTGSLAVSVVGITLGTNFESGFDSFSGM